MSTQDCRIDYVSLRLPFDPLGKAEFVATATERVVSACAEMSAAMTCYRVRSYFDQGLKKSIAVFDVWGPVADLFYNLYAFHYWGEIQRLDYREAIVGEKINWQEFFMVTKAKLKGKLRCDWITSPPRQKDGKRPTGGEGLVIGATDSKRKLSYYQRAKEGPAFEFQFTGSELRRWLNPILKQGAPGNELLERHVFHLLQGEAHKQSVTKTGLSIADLEAGVSVASARIDYTSPDEVLATMDSLFSVLNDDAKSAFIEAHTNADPDEVADALERVKLTRSTDWEEVEPAGFWEGSEWEEFTYPDLNPARPKDRRFDP